MATIRIKRGSGTPSSLETGELAFDETWGVLRIGTVVDEVMTTYSINRQSPLHGYWETPNDKAYPICLKMDRYETQLRLYAKLESGTCNVRLMQAPFTLLGSSELAVSNSAVATQLTTGLTLTSGTQLSLVVSGSSSPVGLAWSLHFGI